MLLADKVIITINYKNLIEKFEIIKDINGDTKNVVLNFLDLVIREHKAKQAYAN